MKKMTWWIPTVIFYVVFVCILVIFHPLQVLAKSLGYLPHKRVVDAMIWCLNNCLLIIGSKPKLYNHNSPLPRDRPMIIVSNHESMFDIPAIGQLLRKYHPKYIAKKRLAKGLPSISYNIRNGGSIVIDRKNAEEAKARIKSFCAYLKQTNRAGCIFPEGTRAWNGIKKPFKKTGLMLMLNEMPEAIVVPVVIKNFWKIGKYRMKPIPFGLKLSCTALPSISRNLTNKEVFEQVESVITQYLNE